MALGVIELATIARSQDYATMKHHEVSKVVTDQSHITTQVQKDANQHTKQVRGGEQGTSIEMQVDEVGPSLRYATAQVTKSTPKSSPHAPHTTANQNYGQGYQQQNTGAQNSAQSFNAPAPF